jgi:hypothetical protein
VDAYSVKGPKIRWQVTLIDEWVLISNGIGYLE